MGTASLEAQPNDVNTLATFTLTSVSFGAEASDRYIIVAISASDETAPDYGITSATIGGVAATVVISTNDTIGGLNTYIIMAAVPTGTTGTIIVNFVGNHVYCYCGVYRVVGLVSATPHATAFNIDDPISTTIDIPSYGLLIGVANLGTTGTAVVTTGLTELYDLSFDAHRVAGGMSQAMAVETARSVGFNGAGACSGSFASWRFIYNPRDIPHSPQHQAQMAS